MVLKVLEYCISIIAFSIVFQAYKYRERDEIVNEQAIIEEIYERELLLNSATAVISLALDC